MTRAVIIFLIISMLCIISAYANERSLTIKGLSYVKHHSQKTNGKWVEGFDNNAIGLEYTFVEKEYYEYSVGGTLVEKNSFGNFGATAHASAKLCHNISDVRACTGLSGGAVYGYKPQTGLLIVPAVLWNNTIKYKSIGIEHNYLPSVGKEFLDNHSSIVGFNALFLTYTYKFKE